ncbi:MAG: SirB1 family protein [Blastocatellia bacterium]
MTKEEARTQFAEMAARSDELIELDRAALLIAAEEYRQLELAPYLAMLDEFAAGVRAMKAVDARARVTALGEYLFQWRGFQGNTTDYYDARNSFLSDVLERKTGIPITLSVVYIEVARRLGLRMRGVGMPGHFLVRYEDEEGELIIDAFHGGKVLSMEQCRELFAGLYGAGVAFTPGFLSAVSARQILIRMLRNLKGIYARAGAHRQTLGTIERVLLLDPDLPEEIRDRGLARAGLREYAAGLRDLEQYLRLRPGAGDAARIREKIGELKKGQARLN